MDDQRVQSIRRVLALDSPEYQPLDEGDDYIIFNVCGYLVLVTEANTSPPISFQRTAEAVKRDLAVTQATMSQLEQNTQDFITRMYGGIERLQKAQKAFHEACEDAREHKKASGGDDEG